jgi:hypothetical protein
MKTLEEHKQIIFEAAVRWQELASEHGTGHPDTSLASGYLYDRVRHYKNALKAESEGNAA